MKNRFVKTFGAYIDCIVAQCEDIDAGKILTRNQYIVFRRENVSARPSFLSGALDLNIPEYVFDNPVVLELEDCGVDLIILDNVRRT